MSTPVKPTVIHTSRFYLCVAALEALFLLKGHDYSLLGVVDFLSTPVGKEFIIEKL